jgi:hypothetical protein
LEKSEAYVINLSLPSKITFRELTVLKDPGDVWWDLLIGVDPIAAGDSRLKMLTLILTGHSVLRPVRAHSETDGAPGKRLN